MKKIFIVANWKCNPTTLAEAKEIFNSVKNGLEKVKGEAEVVVCPPFVYLPALSHGENIAFGSQNCCWEESGAFTGEISPPMIKNLGCEYAIIGHSERRKYFQESNEMINKKIKAVLKAGLTPILCLGETEKQKKDGETFSVLESQFKEGASGVSGIILAYEPVWAIGTGNPCQPEDAKKVLSFLRKFSGKSPILYGGSANSENTESYIKTAGFDGLLVGGASLKAEEFLKIIENAGRL